MTMNAREEWQHDKLEETIGSFDMDTVDAEDMAGGFRRVAMGTGNLVSSKVAGKFNAHMPVIDFDDLEMRLVPSRTTGGWHLYIDKEVDARDYEDLLEALVSCGLIERGILQAFRFRGFTSVRKEGTFAPHSRTQGEKLEELTRKRLEAAKKASGR
jgi:hypothetical protein